MHDCTYILGDSNSGFRFLGAVIFLLIWGIGALSSLLKKSQQAPKRPAPPRTPAMQLAMQRPAPAPAMRRVAPPRRPALAPLRPAQQAVRQISPGRLPAPPRMPGVNPALLRQAAALKQMTHPAPPPMPPRAATPAPRAPARLTPAPQERSPITSGPPARPLGANAASIRRWLTPQSLRKQFILTELLQPALALRE